MANYTIYGSELTASRGNEYETKSLLYLVSIHKESKKMVYYVVDVFNDVSGISEDGKFIVDVQSKAHKKMSPAQLGERLVTLFKNYISEFKFDDYILVVSTLLSKKHLTNIELNQREYDLISLINNNALQLCKKGLKDKIKTYGIFKNMSILKDEKELDDLIDSFLKNVHIFLANQSKSTYIKNILGDTYYQNDELFLEIFNEISKNQIFKKSYNNIENIVIHSPLDVLNFKRHLSYDQIQVLICKRIIDNDYIANRTAVPASFAVYLALKGILGEEQREIVSKCKDEIIVCMFNKNNQELFWEGFMNMFSTLKKLENYDDLDDCYNHLNEDDFNKILLNNKNYYTRIYLLSMIIEGVKNDKN